MFEAATDIPKMSDSSSKKSSSRPKESTLSVEDVVWSMIVEARGSGTVWLSLLLSTIDETSTVQMFEFLSLSVMVRESLPGSTASEVTVEIKESDAA